VFVCSRLTETQTYDYIFHNGVTFNVGFIVHLYDAHTVQH